MMTFVASENVPHEIQAGSPGWMPKEAVAVGFCLSGIKHVLATTDDGLALTTLDADNNPVKSQLITYESPWPGEGVSAPPVLPVPMCARDESVYLGLGNRLVLVTGDKTPLVFDMARTIHSLCGSIAVFRRPDRRDLGAGGLAILGRRADRGSVCRRTKPSGCRLYGQWMDRVGFEGRSASL